MTYWQEQQLKLQNEPYSKQLKRIEKQLTTEYSRVAKEVISDCEDLYLEMLEDGEISYSQLMRYDRYYRLNANINQQLRRLGVREIEFLDTGMNQLYLDIGSLITGSESWALINRAFAEEAVKRAWCYDGKTFSDRVWTHMDTLQSTLQQGLQDCVIKGSDHRKLVRVLRDRFDVAYSDADRLVRTELNYIQNQAAMRGYLDAGYTHYMFISVSDDRICDDCDDLDGQVFAFVDAQEGVNFPPMHPNCRSNIIGYRED